MRQLLTIFSLALFASLFTNCQSSLKLAGKKYDQNKDVENAIASYDPAPILKTEAIALERTPEVLATRKISIVPTEADLDEVVDAVVTHKNTVVAPKNVSRPLKENKLETKRPFHAPNSVTESGVILALLASIVGSLILVLGISTSLATTVILCGFALIIAGFVLGLVHLLKISKSDGRLSGKALSVIAMIPFIVLGLGLIYSLTQII
jgi:hypothetical protein